MRASLQPWLRRKADLGKIKSLYFNDKLTMKEIGIMVNIPTTTLIRWAETLGWKLRSKSELKLNKFKFVPFENLSFKQDSDIIKRQIVAMRGHKCELCSYNLIVDVHHIVPRRFGENNLPENLILLCPNHHREADYGFLILDHYKSGSNRGNLTANSEGNPEGNASLILDSVETEAKAKGERYTKQIDRWVKFVKTPDKLSS